MFQRLVRIANILDKQGQYEQSDIVCSILERIAQKMDPAIEKAVKQQIDSIGDTRTDPDEETLVGETPPKRTYVDPSTQTVIRPELKAFLKANEMGYPTINLQDPETRKLVQEALLSASKNGDTNAEQALVSIGRMESMIKDPRSRPGGVFYGPFLLLTPAGSRTIFEGSETGEGGKHNLTSIFLTKEQMQENIDNMNLFFKYIFSGDKKRSRIDVQNFSGNRDLDKPFLGQIDSIVDKQFNEDAAPVAEFLQNTRKDEAEQRGHKFNTREPREDEFIMRPTRNMGRIDPKSPLFQPGKVYPAMGNLTSRNIKYRDWDPETASQMTAAELAIEGQQGLGGMHTLKIPDTMSARVHPLGSKPGEKRQNTYPNFSPLMKNLSKKFNLYQQKNSPQSLGKESIDEDDIFGDRDF